MKPYIALAVLSALALDAAAQQKTSTPPQPADPAVSVPALPINPRAMATSLLESRNLLPGRKACGDYKDPGWYKHPIGSVAYEWTGSAPLAQRAEPERLGSAATEWRARKPAGHTGH